MDYYWDVPPWLDRRRKIPFCSDRHAVFLSFVEWIYTTKAVTEMMSGQECTYMIKLFGTLESVDHVSKESCR